MGGWDEHDISILNDKWLTGKDCYRIQESAISCDVNMIVDLIDQDNCRWKANLIYTILTERDRYDFMCSYCPKSDW